MNSQKNKAFVNPSRKWRTIFKLYYYSAQAGSVDGRSTPRERRTSKIPQFTEDAKAKNKQRDRLIDVESMETGAVKFSILLYYMKAIGWPMALTIFTLQLAYQGRIDKN